MSKKLLFGWRKNAGLVAWQGEVWSIHLLTYPRYWLDWATTLII